MAEIVLPDQFGADLDALVRAQVEKIRPPTPPEIIWHYTSGAALIQIIESGEMWATQMGCLNDASELRHAITLVRRAAEERRGALTRPSEEDRTFFNVIDEYLKPELAQTVGQFVACFSTKGDDLSQWRAYSDGEGGYAIGFHAPTVFFAGNAAQGSSLLPVVYDERIVSGLVGAVLDGLYALYLKYVKTRGDAGLAEWSLVFLDRAWNACSGLAALVKHSAFAAEDEWRALFWYDQNRDHEKLRFVPRTSMISRHIPLRFPPSENESRFPPKALPISRVVVGPSRHKELSALAVNDLFVKMEYPTGHVGVDLSVVPFQKL
jgi:hypothetical protein